ncbi:squalene synthase HpnC [Aquincola sp. S2]|uniref:Squalene synthase HpnC n=1 Tax=Pseudaquabacterium terrae TaxID=2732868 RepID=A0ABX2EJ64_9BURK|nr:squalene synthase HpnC [Aquabacterium terrae]
MSVDHYENFPVASILCPARLRPAVRAIYAFARTADDIADEGTASPDERRDELLRYRAALHAAFAGAVQDWPRVFQPLAECARRHGLPLSPFDDLLDAFVQDCANPHYQDRAELLDYCRRSANPIGRLLLALYGVHDRASLMQSDAICSALQLINFWQDPSVDLPRGRVYFPATDARRHGLALNALTAGRDDAATQALLRELVQWAGSLMQQGAPLALRLPGRVGWELRLVVQGGLRILEKIEAMQFRTFSQRPTLGRRDFAPMLWRALRMRSRLAAPGWAPL